MARSSIIKILALFPSTVTHIDKTDSRCYHTASLFSKAPAKEDFSEPRSWGIQRSPAMMYQEIAMQIRRFCFSSLLIYAVVVFGQPGLGYAQPNDPTLFLTHPYSGKTHSLVAIGYGKIAQDRGRLPTQEKLMAKRAAMLDAYRKLSGGLRSISSHIQNGNTVLEQSGFIKGAKIMRYNILQNNYFEVELAVPITFMDSVSPAKIEKMAVVYPKPFNQNQGEPIDRDEWVHIMK
ncbi:hypothetical protein IID04_05765 [PVC group bacterium]|nr:hypothetical protein [PVC group bacterium]